MVTVLFLNNVYLDTKIVIIGTLEVKTYSKVIIRAAILENGLQFCSNDGKMSNMLFLICGPKVNMENHVLCFSHQLHEHDTAGLPNVNKVVLIAHATGS